MYKPIYDYDVKEIDIDSIVNKARYNEDDGIIMKSIITNLEKNVAEAVRAGDVANIPKIGNLKYNSIKRVIYKSHLGFKAARKNMDKEQYKYHVASWVIDFQKKQKEKELKDKYFRRLKQINKDKYEYVFTNINRGYAEMFIYAISALTEVPFDEEFEILYHELGNDD